MASPEEINIPQKPPMVMIDRLESADGETTVTSLTIRNDNIFVASGIFREAGLIENMAQTAAAGAGAEGLSESARVGFIAAVKNLNIVAMPCTGDRIVTISRVLHRVLDATIVSAGVTLNDQLIASCEFRIFLVNPSS